MMDMEDVQAFADKHGLWVVEDAAHSFPAAYARSGAGANMELPSPFGRGAGGEGSGARAADSPHPSLLPKGEGTENELPSPACGRGAGGEGTCWRRCGENTAAVSCFSFYANKTMTTGEGGMAVTDDDNLALRMRQMSLHGLSHDAWKRYAGNHAWDYRIAAPGYKYNMTDVAAALGIHQLARAEQMRQERQAIAQFFIEQLADLDQIELPPDPADRMHSWHLFPIRLRLEKLSIDRNEFIVQLRERGVGCSVHWRPLHLHPYYEQTFHWQPKHLPVASAQWVRLVSLPLFQGMREEESRRVAAVVRELCARYARPALRA
jgi:dTDP-4-amino-4,6-dideoxygalactose transaminase